MPFVELNEVLGKKRAAHLLRRTCFAGSSEEIEEFANLTPRQAVERLFDPDLEDPAEPIDPATGTTWMQTGPVEDVNSEERDLIRFFSNWQLGLMTGQYYDATKRPSYVLRERLVYFLHTHFTTKKSVVNSSQALFFQNKLFRFFAYDKEDIIIPGDPLNDIPDRTVEKNFLNLTKKISRDNAMLRFLDGHLNVKGRPNENYARELLELYSIGKGLEGIDDKKGLPNGDYLYFTEQDVQAAARVLSGFDIDRSFSLIDEDTGIPTGTLKSAGGQHDNESKEFSNRLENAIINGDPLLTNGTRPTEESIMDEIDQLLRLIYNQDETAIHICRKLYRFFGYHNVDESIQNSTISDMAEIFKSNNFKIQPVLEAFFTSTYFYDGSDAAGDELYGSLIKSPIDLVIGTFRSFNYQLPDFTTEAQSFHDLLNSFSRSIDLMGLDFYEPFEVAGYTAYHQFPIFNRAWITTNYLTNRYNFINNFINESTSIDPEKVNILDFVLNTFPREVYANATNLIVAIAEYFLPVSQNLDFNESEVSEISDERLNFFYQEFLFKEGLGPTGEEAWNTLFDDDNYSRDIASERLSFLFNAMLQTPEYQLM